MTDTLNTSASLTQPPQSAYVLLVANSKGGVLKATSACQFAAYFARAGYRTVLIDTDRLQSSWDWVNLHHAKDLDTETLSCERVAGKALEQRVRDLKATCDVIVIDVAGSVRHDDSKAKKNAQAALDDATLKAALAVCDRVALPFYPCGLDARALHPFMAGVTEAQQAAHFPISLYLARDFVTDNSRPKVQAFIQAEWPNIDIEYLTARLVTRRSVAEDMGAGRSVWDNVTRTGRARDPKAIADFERLISEMFPDIAAAAGIEVAHPATETAEA